MDQVDSSVHIYNDLSGTVKTSDLVTGKYFIRRGVTHPDANFNELTTSGMYNVSGNCTNAPIPSGYVYGVLCVFDASYGYIYQVHLCIGTQLIYFRSTPNSGTNWNPWQQLAVATS